MSAQFFYIFVSQIPLWVFPLFAVLLTLGIKASRDRLVPIKLFNFLPLVGLFALPGLITSSSGAAIAVFFLAYALGTWFGRHYQRQLVVAFHDGRVQLKGEWLTLVTMMTLFFAGFVEGAVGGINFELANSAGFILPIIAVTAFCSGVFLGRSLCVIGLSRDFQRQVAAT